MRNCPRCLNTAVIEDGYCGHCREATMQPMQSSLPPLRPVMTERERVFQATLERMAGYLDMSIETGHISIIGIKYLKEECEKALNFKYGGGDE